MPSLSYYHILIDWILRVFSKMCMCVCVHACRIPISPSSLKLCGFFLHIITSYFTPLFNVCTPKKLFLAVSIVK